MCKRTIFSILSLLLLAVITVSCKGDNTQTTITNMRCEYQVNPIGLDTPSPRFTWEYAGNENGFRASRYEIKVGTSEEDLTVLTDNFSFASHTRYYWNVTVWDGKGRQCAPSAISSFEMGKMSLSDWSGKWITDNKDKEFEPAPMFRRSFSLEKEVKEARFYIASAGYHEFFINNERVGENYLDPGYTQFDSRILYVTHDVTPLLQKGTNAIAAVLGNAWYNIQSRAVWDFETARWRDRPRVLAELRLTFADGSVETIMTDEKWLTTTGPYTYNNLYSGDMYDAQKEESGWKTASFDDSHWAPIVLTEAPAPLLVSQQMPAIQIVEELKPIALKKFSDKLYVYSFVKNISGLPRLKVKGQPGTRITIKHGELLKADGRLEQGNINVYYPPLKPYEVFQMDVFTLKGTGEEEVFMPSFTYHGFQYVEIESDKPIALIEDNLTAQFMHTAVEPVGSFTCSNPLFNKIWDATMLAYRCNLHSIPTDCPQREKNGWTADAHVAIDLALLGFDGLTFYEKWMNDFIDNQRENGQVSGIIPSSGWGFGEWPGPVWDAALFIIPNALYDYYGDSRCIEKLYPTMLRYMEYLKKKEEQYNGTLPFGLGDWVYWKATTNNEYTSTAYYYYDTKLMARFAEILGKDATPYQQKAESLKALINEKFFDAETAVYAEGTQTAQALALYLGLVPEGKEQAVADKLHEVVAGNDYFLDFGLLGSKTVPAMLAKYGYIEDAMKMATKTDAPSWGYWVETMGYTTLPETWTLSPEFRDASLNHVFMGDISAWMMNQLAGINYDAPGFKQIKITPHFVEGLDWAKGSYKSVRGLITSEWKREGEKVKLTVSIPADCTAEIIVGDKVKKVSSGTFDFTY